MEYYGGDQGDKGEDKYYGNGGAEYTADNYEYDEIDPYLNIEYQNYDTQNYDRQNYADQYEPYGNQYGGDEMYDEQDYEGQDPYGAPYGEYGGEGYARDYSYNGGGYQGNQGPIMTVGGGEGSGGKRRRGANRRRSIGYSDHDSASDGGYSIRSSLVKTPASQASGQDVDIFGAYRTKTADAGRYGDYAPSTDSLLHMLEAKKRFKPTGSVGSFLRNESWVSNPKQGEADFGKGEFLFNDAPYPSWSDPNQIPLSKEEIEDIFKDLAFRLGFQQDNMKNMYDMMMVLLDSRASRMSPGMALLTLHADYIGGDHANYRRWYFSAQLDKDTPAVREETSRKKKREVDELEANGQEDDTIKEFEENWRAKMSALSQYEKARQIALWFLLWGEAGNLRFCSELLCFIFKMAEDYYKSVACQQKTEAEPENWYLRNIVKPVYDFVRDEGYVIIKGKMLRRERDHIDIIGYDDLNETFWMPKGLYKLKTMEEKQVFMDIAPEDRWLRFKDINFKKSISKTYKERRTIAHILTNFSRVWIMHVVVYLYYIMYASNFLYDVSFELRDSGNPNVVLNGQVVKLPDVTPRMLTLVAAMGAFAPLISILGTLFEITFVEKSRLHLKILFSRIGLLIGFFILDLAPVYFCLKFGYDPRFEEKKYSSWVTEISDGYDPEAGGNTFVFPFEAVDEGSVKSSALRNFKIVKAVSIVQLIYSIAITVYLAIIIPGKFMVRNVKGRGERGLINQTFTANFPPLPRSARSISVALWLIIFGCKYLESYFFLALSFKDTFRWLYFYQPLDCNERFLGNMLCSYQNYITLFFMLLLDLFLFFLDTYLWYVVWNTLFSVFISFHSGISILTPWKNIFSRLPKRIYTKVLATSGMEIKYKPKVLCSQVWNAIIISMYREHLLSIEHVQKLLYQQVPSDESGKRSLKQPSFFVSQDDSNTAQEYYPPHSEAERRISFFAQSLSTVVPEAIPVENMPTFTVLTPHYGEKILFTLREIIRESDKYSRVTVLEYLKALHADEWNNFVKDTKLLAEEHTPHEGGDTPVGSKGFEEKSDSKNKADDLPFYSVGFKSSSPEFTLRTRIWASLRSQTLYRTVSGFMNYAKAIKLLYRVENPEMVYLLGGNGSQKLEGELDHMANRKFRFVVAMQRYFRFNKEELESVEFLLHTYPSLKIVFIDEDTDPETGETRYYSALIDGTSEIVDGKRKPIYRVEMPGYPILGDGKSDNQNHAVIFTRGEYVQMIDANQDNYLEECLKIRNVLGEFEEFDPPEVSPYSPNATPQIPPVAIVGAREYIFSESVGVLGDVAAGKEATFGTLTQRMMAKVGGRLHYGHPDFINFTFMSTRGGFSKAQKGLHLNEDIYAGMNAFSRGGRIKHTEYFQCGKGRDLGFCSTLNFITKIGTGMGEQMLSREYYWLSCFLPLDRFLTFYYAHPGFHVNNLIIMASVQLFMISAMFVASMSITVNVCPPVEMSNPNYPYIIIPQKCLMLQPINNWITRTTLAILIVLLIAFLPLFLHMLTEQGFIRAITRLGKQLISLSPMYEVEVTQIYAYSIGNNLSFGGARYIGTGRGFATSRLSFATLYTRFADASIYFGAGLMLILIFITASMWKWSMLYFWFSIAALIVSPFLFNPHMFVRTDFILDYKDWLSWFGEGNSSSNPYSWISHVRMNRIRVTGYKRKRLAERIPSAGNVSRAKFFTILVSEIISPIILALISVIAFAYTHSRWGVAPDPTNDTKVPDNRSSIAMIVILSFIPILVNAVVSIALFAVSFFVGPMMSMCLPGYGRVMAAISHVASVVVHVVVFFLLCVAEKFDLSRAALGVVTIAFVQRAIFSVLISLLLTREFGDDEANIAWWTGKWYDKGMGIWIPTLILREWLCKISEASIFVADALIGQIIFIFFFIITFLPFADKWHSAILFWLSPSKQIRPPIYSIKQRKQRRRTAFVYGIILTVLLAVFIVVVVGINVFKSTLVKIATNKSILSLVDKLFLKF